MKPGYTTTEMTFATLNGGGVIALVETLPADASLGQCIATGLACLALAILGVGYALSRARVKGGGE